jgi:hypothetical protein
MDAVDTSKDYKRTAVIVIDRKGQKLVRKMETYNKKYGPDERSLIKFIKPPDVRGIMYLTWGYEDIERDDERVSKKQKDTNYSKRIIWAREDIWLSVKIEYYNKRGNTIPSH